MTSPRGKTVAIAVIAAAITCPSNGVVAQNPARPPAFTLGDEMTMRAVVDLRIAPDGEKVAYAVSTPSLTKNQHEAALFVVSSRGGSPQRMAEDVHIFNTPSPRPQIRWSPDSATISIVGLTPAGPQVFAIPPSGGSRHRIGRQVRQPLPIRGPVVDRHAFGRVRQLTRGWSMARPWTTRSDRRFASGLGA